MAFVNCLTFWFSPFVSHVNPISRSFHDDAKCLSEWLHKTIDVISFSKYLLLLSLKCPIITFEKLFNALDVVSLYLYVFCDAFWKVSCFLCYRDHITKDEKIIQAWCNVNIMNSCIYLIDTKMSQVGFYTV